MNIELQVFGEFHRPHNGYLAIYEAGKRQKRQEGAHK